MLKLSVVVICNSGGVVVADFNFSLIIELHLVLINDPRCMAVIDPTIAMMLELGLKVIIEHS